ncbi:hypothetical protein BC826DRAFT_960019 [Russula brevipes]|nr:hypothetical protein BC826DRAFT_960019 [Russula brevipes]
MLENIRVSGRASDNALFSRQSGLSEPDTIAYAMSVARRLYRCKLICEDAFPSPSTKGVWLAWAWNEACVRAGVNPSVFPLQDEELADTSMALLSDMNTGMKHTVESLYGFDTSRAPDSISHNASHAQALLTSMSFIYREPNFGGKPCHPYRHPIIQRAINALWFQNTDSDGIIFYEYFAPIPIQAIALVLTVIECCIDEWVDGTWKNSCWNDERYKTVYRSHVESLTDLRDYNSPQSLDLLEQMQRELLQNARAHAGAPPDPVTGSGSLRLRPRAINAALQEDLPEYDEHNIQTPTINASN